MNVIVKLNRKVSCNVLPNGYSIKYRKINTFNYFWDWTTKVRPSWKENSKEALIAFTVFGVTGSSTLYFVRPMLSTIGLNGNFIDGPWTYRIGSILIISPIYAMILFTIGTISGRHRFFASMAFKILGRFVPKKILSKVICEPALLKIKSP
jgi:hypothetical protein